MPPNPVSAIQSAFTPSGTNALQTQEGYQRGLTGDAAALLKQLFPTLQQEQTYSNNLVPTQESDMNRMLMLASPGNDQARAALVNNAAYSNAARAAKQAGQQDQAAGLSPAFQAGQEQGITNAAAEQANQYQQQINSPQYQLAQAQNLMGQLNQAQQMPGMSELGNLGQLIYGAPKVQLGQGLGQFLGSLAGDYVGGLGKSGGGEGTTINNNSGSGDSSGDNGPEIAPNKTQYPVPAGPPSPSSGSNTTTNSGDE